MIAKTLSRPGLTLRELSGPAKSALHAIAPSAEERALLSVAGKALVGKERYHDAVRLFEFLVLTCPENGYYQRCFGICCEQLDRLDEAAAALHRAIQIDPADDAALLARASVRLRMGDRPGAIADANAAAANIRNPDSEISRRVRVLRRQLSPRSTVSEDALKTNPAAGYLTVSTRP